MPLEGSVTTNDDKTKNYSLTATKENVTANAFVNGYRSEVNPLMPNAPQYSVVGASVGLGSELGHAVSLSGQHVPKAFDRVTASGNMGLIRTDDHKLDINAFTATTIPKAAPNFATHGAGVDYAFREKFGANASVSHTPMFKQTDYSIGGGINLHKTPTSSLDFGVGASRTDTSFGRGNWDKKVFLGLKKTF